MSSTLKLTVCGAGNAGSAIAADSAMGGTEVTLFELPRFAANYKPFLEKGGITISGDSDPAWGKRGFAKLKNITSDPAEAAKDADVIMITVPAMYHSVHWDAIAPHLKAGQIVLFNTGYFACLRHGEKLKALGKDVVLAESNIMPYLCSKKGDTVHIDRYKRNFRVAAFPGKKTDEIFGTLHAIYPQYEKVPNVLDTNIASGGNPAFHVTLTIPISGFYLDKYRGGLFYQDTTVQGGRLIEAYDRERKVLSQLLGSSCYQTTMEFEGKSYEYFGKDIVDTLRKSEHINWFATAEYIEQLLDEDILFAYAPMVFLAEQLGAELPVIRSMTELCGAMLDKDYWSRAVTLKDLGIEGMDRNRLLEYVTQGK